MPTLQDSRWQWMLAIDLHPGKAQIHGTKQAWDDTQTVMDGSVASSDFACRRRIRQSAAEASRLPDTAAVTACLREECRLSLFGRRTLRSGPKPVPGLGLSAQGSGA